MKDVGVDVETPCQQTRSQTHFFWQVTCTCRSFSGQMRPSPAPTGTRSMVVEEDGTGGSKIVVCQDVKIEDIVLREYTLR